MAYLLVVLVILILLYSIPIFMARIKPLILLLGWGRSLMFMSRRFLTLYIRFEVRLVPILLIILGWGYQQERLLARSYLIIYTISLSLPLFFIVIYLLMVGEGFLFRMGLSSKSFIVIFCLFGAFLVKTPLFLFHSWLPKAHVEAPTVGSVLLAAILLKLGVYGIYRRLIFSNFVYSPLLKRFVTLLILGCVITTFLCVFQSDRKSLIAFSSVAHINFLVVALILLLSKRREGGVVIIVAHGVVRGIIFYLFGSLFYSQITRTVIYSKSVVGVGFVVCVILSFIANFGVPPSLSSIGEILLISSVFSIIKGVGGILIVYILIAGYFTVFLLTGVC